MLMPILSGLIVSVDAFFIGLSLGMQKSCKFLFLAIMNAFLLVLCFIGFFIAGQVYERIPIDPDLIVGFAFISLGLWTILQYFVSLHIKRKKDTNGEVDVSKKTFILIGIVMSVEAMLITMGITLIFHPGSTIIIPLTVAFAHFAYSALSFYMARTKHVKRLPVTLSHVISGFALIVYGMLALFVEIGV